MAVVAGLVLAIVSVGYKEFLVVSHPTFAVCGLPTRWLQHLLMLLLALAVVISLQAVGVVLVSVMLITPAATAYFLTDRMHRMIWLDGRHRMAAVWRARSSPFRQQSLPPDRSWSWRQARCSA